MDPFAHELYRQITQLKKIDPKDLAQKIGVAMDTIYRYDRDDIKTPLYRARQIVSVTRSIELARAVLDGTGFIPVPEPEGKVSTDAIDRDQVNVLLAASDAVKGIQNALEDGRITRREMKEIDDLLQEMMVKAHGLKIKLNEMRG